MEPLIDIAFIQFHDTTYYHPAGKSFQQKTRVKEHAGLDIKFNEEKKRFSITWANQTSYMPETSVAQWMPVTPNQAPLIENVHKTEDKRKRAGAQVSTPHGHVFAGPGAGDAGRG